MNSGSEQASFKVKPEEREDNADEGLKVRVGWAAEPDEGGVPDDDWVVLLESPIVAPTWGVLTSTAGSHRCDGDVCLRQGWSPARPGQGCRRTRISDRRGHKGGSGHDGRRRSGDTNFGSNGRNSSHFFPKAVND